MSQSVLAPDRPPVLEMPAPSAPARPKPATRQPDRHAFQHSCELIAQTLANSSFEERMELYRWGTFTPRELSTAAALRPDLMPVLNGEFEWIALTLADLD